MAASVLLPGVAEIHERDACWRPRALQPRITGHASERLRAAAAALCRDLSPSPNPPLSHSPSPESASGSKEESIPLVINCQGTAHSWPRPDADESYSLQTSSQQISLQAQSDQGALHGLETLRQLISARGRAMPEALISDRPAYPWRGLMLDCARHWLDIQTLERVLEKMARLRLNVLHLHLSDDQAFRMEVEGLPQLSKASFDGRFYRQEELSALARFAGDLGIRLAPEIDIPAHVTALLSACPELAAKPGEYAPSADYGSHAASLDPSLERTYEVIEQICESLVAVFPDPCVHIGGDEVDPQHWHDSQRISQWSKAQGLIDAHAIQCYFLSRVARILRRLGRRTMVWDEALHEDLPRDIIIQSWRGSATRDAALRAGHDVVCSSGYYLDLNLPAATHFQFDPGGTPEELRQAEKHQIQAIEHDLASQAAAKFLASCQPPALPAAPERGQLLGGEACMWTELVDSSNLEIKLFPRLAAIAERLWLGADAPAASDLEPRLRRWQRQDSRPPLQRSASNLQIPGQALTAVRTLLRYAQPIRWYRRLLGDSAIARRAEGDMRVSKDRPYNAKTALSRLVDICPPESLAALHLQRHARNLATEGLAMPSSSCRKSLKKLRKAAGKWRRPQRELAPLAAASPIIKEVMPLASLLAESADLLEELLAKDPPADITNRIRATEKPIAEMNLAVAPILRTLAGLDC